MTLRTTNQPRRFRVLAIATAIAVALGVSVAGASPALASNAFTSGHGSHDNHGTSQKLAPRTHFTMKPDGSSGRTQGGDGIPNIDSVKKTIAAYYGDPGTGIANKTSSPYVSEMASIVRKASKQLLPAYKDAIRHHEKPAIVVDGDDTTLMTYDMEVGAMHFNFTPALQDVWVQDERFPATPSMVGFVNAAKAMGYTVFGLSGRNDNQKAATLDNLSKDGYTAFTAGDFYTKWTGTGSSQQPSYIHCAAVACTTVEFKALTRKHIEKLGYTITLNVGDQWSDLQGGYAKHIVKLPNPTYYLPSTNLPGVHQRWLSPHTRFTMKPDGSSGLTQRGDAIPNIDSVKKTIATYYGDTGSGASDKTASPYITQMRQIVKKQLPKVASACFAESSRHKNPAVVLDADDTTLWTYDMEVGDMHFNYNPTEQNVWVQGEKFPATPSMVTLEEVAKASGCTIIGLTGRNDNQKAVTLANLAKVGYTGFTSEDYYTKWTGVGSSQQPSYITCAAASCTTSEFKSQTRAHVESAAGGGYDVVANFGDQYSDLVGGHADRTIKLPNPTYYLP